MTKHVTSPMFGLPISGGVLVVRESKISDGLVDELRQKTLASTVDRLMVTATVSGNTSTYRLFDEGAVRRCGALSGSGMVWSNVHGWSSTGNTPAGTVWRFGAVWGSKQITGSGAAWWSGAVSGSANEYSAERSYRS